MKKLPSHSFRAPDGGLFWAKAWLPTGQILSDQIFLIILNLKYKIVLRQLIAKRTKIGIVIFGPSAHSHQPKYCYYKLIVGISSNFQSNILSNGWESLTNHCFLAPRPQQTNPCLRNFFLRRTYFFAQRDALTIWVGEIFNAHFAYTPLLASHCRGIKRPAYTRFNFAARTGPLNHLLGLQNNNVKKIVKMWHIGVYLHR